KEKVAKRKHALPTRPRHYVPRVHSAAGIFRRDILVSSKNDVHPCTSPLRGLVRRLRRCGREPGKSKAQEQKRRSKSKITGNGNGNGNGNGQRGKPRCYGVARVVRCWRCALRRARQPRQCCCRH